MFIFLTVFSEEEDRGDGEDDKEKESCAREGN